MFLACAVAAQQQPSAPVQSAQPSIIEWRDDFDGDKLDEAKWDPFTFEGGSGGKIEVKNNQLKMRGAGVSRSGVRTKQAFHGDRFYVEEHTSELQSLAYLVCRLLLEKKKY